MGKRLKPQRRGSGTGKYRSAKNRCKVRLRFRTYDDVEKTGVIRGQVVDFVDDPARNALLMKVKYDNNEDGHLIAPEGICVGDYVELGVQAKVAFGNVLPLYRIPEGTSVYNIEKTPGDGGKFIRAPGTAGTIVAREGGFVSIKLPSRKTINVSSESRAQVGVINGGGLRERPLMKAGNAHHKHKAKSSRIWPKVRGVAMSAYNHPHGGKQHHAGKPTTVARGTPPGGKVGHIAAKRTGRKAKG
jgi:large subunit ribosomal protein L2